VTALVTPQHANVPDILKALQSRCIRIPDDLSLIGLVDDLVSRFSPSPLTAIGFPSAEMGKQAANILIEHLDGHAHPHQQVLLPAPLMVGSSTGPARPR
ncbi:MAG: substrate-binding domain-containing protein, partial [Anaerolineae bacterium]|nr:substrate-binding domain-containing protein [Anaerolineae bacterium]